MLKSNCWQILGEELRLKSGSILAIPGMVPSCCYYIRSGNVLAYTENDNGLKNAYCMFRAGDVILENNLLRGRCNSLYFETTGRAVVRRITRFQLETALKQYPELYRDLLEAVMEFSDCLVEYKLNEQRGNAASRLSSLFLNLAKTYGIEENGNIVIRQKLSQELLGELAGLHRITVIRELKKMQERSLVLRRMPWYVIPDVMHLTEYRDQQYG